MDKKNNCGCGQEPKSPQVNTQVRPEDMEPVKSGRGGEVSWEEVEDATVVVNPDPDSMESRG